MSEGRESYSFEMCRLGVRGIRRRPWRAVLTFLTIMLAIACVVSTVAVIRGATSQVTEDIRGFGAHCVNIYSPDIANPMAVLGGSQLADSETQPLTLADGRALEDAIEGARAAPVRFQLARVVGPAATRLAPAIATTPEFQGTFDSQLIAGRFLTGADVARRRAVCALDRALAVDLLTPNGDEPSAEESVDPRRLVGQKIRVRLEGDDQDLEVVGIFEDPISLRQQLNAFDNAGARFPLARLLSFKNVYLPLSWLADESTPLQAIYLDLSASRNLDRAARAVRPLLDERGHENAFVFLRRDWIDSVVTNVRELSALGNISWIVTLMIALIMTATISLVAIRERLPEVALRRVEGARRRDILLQFVSESVLVSATAGAAGIGVGVLATRVLLATVLPWEPEITLGSFVLAVVLSIAVGVLATVLPAHRATRLEPIHYLRDL